MNDKKRELPENMSNPQADNKKDQPGSEVRFFPRKLWLLVENPEFNTAISWSNDGLTFQINPQNLVTTCLGKENRFFKTYKLKSFIRQLHLYGFKKIHKNQYQHPNFRRDQPKLLSLLRRENAPKIESKYSLENKAPQQKSSRVTETNRVTYEFKRDKSLAEICPNTCCNVIQENSSTIVPPVNVPQNTESLNYNMDILKPVEMFDQIEDFRYPYDMDVNLENMNNMSYGIINYNNNNVLNAYDCDITEGIPYF